MVINLSTPENVTNSQILTKDDNGKLHVNIEHLTYLQKILLRNKILILLS